ncbi:MAG TPA: amidase, partial [Alphaproteobacteria bacterium]|nr:amidase [Alphaproteobacteria bacterium]
MSLRDFYDRSDAIDIAGSVRARDVSAAEVLDEAIARAERVNLRLNALAARDYDRARAAAKGSLDGPLAGVPLLVKDLGPSLGGVPMTMGSRYFASYVPAAGHEFFTRLRSAGAVIFAKTTAPEFGLLPYTESTLFGATRNPWDLERTPGGSSGGSAALCAAGVVPVAHGNDMGGSIRIPASCVGLFGLKPSRGRAPTTGGIIGSANVDHAIARTVRDSAAFLDVVRSDGGPRFLNEVERDPAPLRIAVMRGSGLGHGISAQARAAVDAAAALCASLGHAVVEAEPEGVDYPAVAYALLLIFASQIGWHL